MASIVKQIEYLYKELKCLAKDVEECCRDYHISRSVIVNTSNNNFSLTFLDQDGTIDVVPFVAPTGLEAIDEGNGIGHRMIGRDPDLFGPIGYRAYDFSFSTENNNLNGSTGLGAISFGLNIRNPYTETLMIGRYIHGTTTHSDNGSNIITSENYDGGESFFYDNIYNSHVGVYRSSIGSVGEIHGSYRSVIYQGAIFGDRLDIWGNKHSIIAGTALTNGGHTSIIGIANRNLTVTPASAQKASNTGFNPRFVVASGEWDTDNNTGTRSNSFVVMSDSLVVAPSMSITQIDNPTVPEPVLRDRFTGVVTPDPLTTQEAIDFANRVLTTKEWVQTEIAKTAPIVIRGSYDADTNTPDLVTPGIAVATGDMYLVSVGGTAFYGEVLEAGDSITALINTPILVTDWSIKQGNIDTTFIAYTNEANLFTQIQSIDTPVVDKIKFFRSGVEYNHIESSDDVFAIKQTNGTIDAGISLNTQAGIQAFVPLTPTSLGLGAFNFEWRDGWFDGLVNALGYKTLDNDNTLVLWSDGSVSAINSDRVLNDSDVPGTTVTEALNNLYLGGKQKTIRADYTLVAEDSGYFIYIDATLNVVITVVASALGASFFCEFENLADFEVKFEGADLVTVESTNDPVYLVGNVLNKDDACEIRRVGTSNALRLKGQLTFGGEIVAYDDRVSTISRNSIIISYYLSTKS